MTDTTTTTALSRPNYSAVAPDALQGISASSAYLRTSTTLERTLLHLVDLRASQINGCAFCIAMHTTEARADGEREERLYALSAWREAGWYSPRERAALAWTEAVTEIGRAHVSDELYTEARAVFSERELIDLTVAVATINTWNRLAIAFGSTAEQGLAFARSHARA